MGMKEIIVCLVAGLGAGLGTGFAGMSAAAIISPMLIAFLGVDAYEAVGIALASDILASAISALTYWNHKNIDIKNGVYMMSSVLVFTLIASYASSFLPSVAIGTVSVFMTLVTGIKFLVKPVLTTREDMDSVNASTRRWQSIVCGAAIGCICGFVGAGGGMMMLLILTCVLGYELKTAVGTSVFIMTFTALTGSVSHFAIGGLTHPDLLIACVVSTLAFAQIAARIANHASPKVLNQITGCLLTVLGISIICFNYWSDIIHLF